MTAFKIFTLIILTGLLLSCQSKKSLSTIDNSISNEEVFDPALANELGADDYGMKSYVFAFLKSGPNRTEDPEESAKLMRAHLDNIGRLAKEGKLVLAGPFLDNSEIRGIYIFNTSSTEQAAEWTNTDPAIQSGHLIMDLKPWYGSAALGIVNKYHKKVQAKSI